MNDMSTVASGNLVSVREAAQKLGLSRIQVANYIRAGKLPADRSPDGKTYVIHVDDVARFKRGKKGNPNFSRKSS